MNSPFRSKRRRPPVRILNQIQHESEESDEEEDYEKGVYHLLVSYLNICQEEGVKPLDEIISAISNNTRHCKLMDIDNADLTCICEVLRSQYSPIESIDFIDGTLSYMGPIQDFVDVLLKGKIKSFSIVNHRELGDVGVIMLANEIRKIRNLHSIRLSNVGLTDAGLDALYRELHEGQTINLSNNHLGESSGVSLGKMLQSGIINLDISRNKIGNNGLKKISGLIKPNNRGTWSNVLRIRGLNLSHNEIGYQGLEAFCEGILYYNSHIVESTKRNMTLNTSSLPTSFPLRSLDLSSNYIDDMSAKLLLEILSELPYIDQLNLQYNQISDKMVQYITENKPSKCIILIDPQSKHNIPILPPDIDDNLNDFKLNVKDRNKYEKMLNKLRKSGSRKKLKKKQAKKLMNNLRKVMSEVHESDSSDEDRENNNHSDDDSDNSDEIRNQRIQLNKKKYSKLNGNNDHDTSDEDEDEDEDEDDLRSYRSEDDEDDDIIDEDDDNISNKNKYKNKLKHVNSMKIINKKDKKKNNKILNKKKQKLMELNKKNIKNILNDRQKDRIKKRKSGEKRVLFDDEDDLLDTDDEVIFLNNNKKNKIKKNKKLLRTNIQLKEKKYTKKEVEEIIQQLNNDNDSDEADDVNMSMIDINNHIKGLTSTMEKITDKLKNQNQNNIENKKSKYQNYIYSNHKRSNDDIYYNNLSSSFTNNDKELISIKNEIKSINKKQDDILNRINHIEKYVLKDPNDEYNKSIGSIEKRLEKLEERFQMRPTPISKAEIKRKMDKLKEDVEENIKLEVEKYNNIINKRDKVYDKLDLFKEKLKGTISRVNTLETALENEQTQNIRILQDLMQMFQGRN